MKYENIIFIIALISYSVLIIELFNKNYKIIFFYFLIFGLFFLFFQKFAFILAFLFLIIIILCNYFSIKEYQKDESETEEESDYDRANEKAKSVEDKLKELRDQEENSEEPDKTTNCQVSVTQVLTKNDPPPPDTSSHENAGEEYRNEVANVFESIKEQDVGTLGQKVEF